MKADFLELPNKPEYEWAFIKGTMHNIDHSKGYLLKKFKHILCKQ